MGEIEKPYESPTVEEIGDGDCPIGTSSMISVDM